MNQLLHETPPSVAFWTQARIDETCDALRGHHGFNLAGYDRAFLAKSLENRRRLLGDASGTAYLERLKHDRREAFAFLQSLAIGYSLFFRNPLAFALLSQSILPRLADACREPGTHEIRIWSAGCAAGQEAWTLAMLLDELECGRGTPIPFRIIATDISERALSRARDAVYDASDLQNVPLRFVGRYFSYDGSRYSVVPTLRSRVDFSSYDLLDDTSSSPAASIYGDFDLVFCCNVLFYYNSDARERILDKLHQSIRPGGFLVTGETERDSIPTELGLHMLTAPSPVFQKRSGHPEPRHKTGRPHQGQR